MEINGFRIGAMLRIELGLSIVGYPLRQIINA
jgi:hypothetical protein